MNPTKGRIVYYKVTQDLELAAIVTDTRVVQDTAQSPEYQEIRVCVFDTESFKFTGWIRQGDQPGQWNWPVREAATPAVASTEPKKQPTTEEIVAAVVAALNK